MNFKKCKIWCKIGKIILFDLHLTIKEKMLKNKEKIKIEKIAFV